MNWFQGEIVDAIVKSKQDQAIFVVYIEGKPSFPGYSMTPLSFFTFQGRTKNLGKLREL